MEHLEHLKRLNAIVDRHVTIAMDDRCSIGARRMLLAEVAAIEWAVEIIERLPVTADGATIVPGMKLWVIPYPEANNHSVQETEAEIVTMASDKSPHGEVYISGYKSGRQSWAGYFQSNQLFATPEAAQAVRTDT